MIINLDLPGMRFFCSFAKRQKFQPDFSRIAFCLQNRLSGNHETETALTKLLHQTRVDLYKSPSYFSTCVLVCRNYPTTFLGLSESNKYPNKFLCLHNYISNLHFLVQPRYPCRMFALPKLVHVPILTYYTPACCNCKSLLWHEHA